MLGRAQAEFADAMTWLAWYAAPYSDRDSA